jgi:hypothetical protein
MQGGFKFAVLGGCGGGSGGVAGCEQERETEWAEEWGFHDAIVAIASGKRLAVGIESAWLFANNIDAS